MPRNRAKLPRKLLRWLGVALAGGLLTALLLVACGDGGLGQRWLDGAESRALTGRPTPADRLGLRLLYTGINWVGWLRYPQAAGLLAYYRSGRGDTLRFDARPLLRHPEVREALRQGRPGITFRRQQRAQAGPFYAVRRTDWPLYYAFDLLYIRPVPAGVAFYDNYFFQPVARRSYTRFQLGRLRLRLNDGLIHVAYPQARAFVAYGEVRLLPAGLTAHQKTQPLAKRLGFLGLPAGGH